MGGAPGERAGFHEGGQTAVTVSGNGAHRAIPAHLSGRSLLVRRAPVASRGMIRGVYTFQAGVALTTLNQEFWKFVRTDGPIVAISISIRENSYQILLAQPALLPPQRAVSNHAAVVANDRFLEQRGRRIVERFP